MKQTKSQQDLMRTNWAWGSDIDGRWTWDTLNTAAACETARLLGNVESVLRSILNRLDQLGVDGLHELLRHERRRVRKSEQLRKARIAAKRRRTIQAKRAA